LKNYNKKVGLFFGSFNPVHVGHMIIANYMVEHSDLEEVWIVVSPHNPLKEKKSLANDYDRLHLVQLAIGENPNIKASSIEFNLPKPSYTIDTMAYLKEEYPDTPFVLLMGGDNLENLHKWKNYELLLRDYEIYVYKRPSYGPSKYKKHPKVRIYEAPQMNISATFIRRSLREGKSVQYLVPDAVFKYLESSNMYR
jgi:nicotinate-nucleotide adenylyltransferase